MGCQIWGFSLVTTATGLFEKFGTAGCFRGGISRKSLESTRRYGVSSRPVRLCGVLNHTLVCVASWLWFVYLPLFAVRLLIDLNLFPAAWSGYR